MKKHKKLKRLVSFMLILALGICQNSVAQADRSVSEIESDKDDLEDEIDSLEGEIDDLDSELYEMILEIASLNEYLEELAAEIEETQQNLADAQAACDEQYASMKIRIKYMYEAPTESMLEMLVESTSVSEFLNRVEYVNDVYEFDRNKMDEYVALRTEVEELEAALEEEQADVESTKAEIQSEESALNTLIDQKEAQLSDKESELKTLEKELKTAKEKAAKEAAEKAKKEAEARAKSASLSNSSVSGDSNPSPTTSVSGDAVVSYACQFVGNPYVWGGTSLTNGCDCSGFVQQVYAAFGISLGSGRATSASLRSVGQAVSYDYMQAGDIVCYAGHVGIYMGNGCIVEAQSKATGITCNRSVNCHTILAIRRVI